MAHFRLETLSPNQAHSYTWRRFCCSTYPTEGFLSVDRHVPGALTRLRALNSTVQWVATMQLANGSLGIPMTPGGERATRTASLLQWATLRLAEDSVATQAQASLTRWVDYITSAEGALETGVNMSHQPTQRFDSFPYIKNGFIDLQHQKRFGRRGALQRFGRGLPLCYGLRVLNRSTRVI
eukprot:COSAG01_NODE_2148_length_8299_cov_283.948177_11_plen_181_part_00